MVNIANNIGNFIDASSRLIFLEAMEHWSDATCITFTYARPEDVDYLLFSYGEM